MINAFTRRYMFVSLIVVRTVLAGICIMSFTKQGGISLSQKVSVLSMLARLILVLLFRVDRSGMSHIESISAL